MSAFSLAPFLGFLDDNRMELPSPRQVLLVGLLTTVLALTTLYLFLVVRRGASADRIAVGIGAFLVCFFNYSRVFDTSPPIPNRWPQLLLWTIASAALVMLAWRLAEYDQVVLLLVLLGVCLCAFSLLGYLTGRPDQDVVAPDPADSEPSTPVTSTRAPAHLPNVYYFLLDEYARADQLQEVVGIDNEPFVESLREQGFDVGDESFSSYTKTLLAVPSVLDMQYLADEESDLPGGILQFDEKLRGDNATVRRFEELGYEYVYSPTGAFEWTRCDDTAAHCIPVQRSGLDLDETEVALLRLTPLGSLTAARLPHTDPVYVLEELNELGSDLEPPYFVFAHVLNPHGPQRYAADCELRNEFHFRGAGPSPADVAAYGQDVGCLNKLILEAVDRILAEEPDAIIVVQGDHGTRFLPSAGNPPSEWDAADHREILGTLDAIRLPAGCEQPAPGPRSTVNTFRVVFACIEGTDVEQLEDRAFIWHASDNTIEEIDDPRTSLAPEGSD